MKTILLTKDELMMIDTVVEHRIEDLIAELPQDEGDFILN
ncbi:hypothetical protein SAMN04487866_105117 [Thermoactinomyces sp. DSM 45891]|nr:hypothetical protein SAMN04487866_105117 [Thermoactinomyces sp. DSM 45891]